MTIGRAAADQAGARPYLTVAREYRCFLACRPINHHLQTGKPLLILQLLNSCLLQVRSTNRLFGEAWCSIPS